MASDPGKVVSHSIVTAFLNVSNEQLVIIKSARAIYPNKNSISFFLPVNKWIFSNENENASVRKEQSRMS